MSCLRTALLAISAAGFASLSSAAFAEALTATYDPVAHALAHGLTPDSVDAAFDRGLVSAESCDAFAIALQTVACTSRDVAGVALATLPPVES